jgi:pimeloyl-ACP methyl ester carboxylesterase
VKGILATSLAVLMATQMAALTMLIGPTSQAAPAALRFGPCPPDVSKPYPRMQCATVEVPLNYNAPAGERIPLTISRLPARNRATRRGVLLVNPGGPGGPGVSFAGELSQALPPAVLDSYDLIGFDPRNTGHSAPIHCADPETYWKDPLPDPDSPATRALNWRRASEYSNACAQHAGKYLPFLTTVDNARDIDQIRAALGESKINYLGYSYGTYLGAVYGQLFPHRVDRMILDSSVNPDPASVWYRDNFGQDVPAQRRLNEFFDWIARYDGVFHLGANRAQVAAAWTGILNDLRAKPHGPLGPYEFIDITFSTLYGEKQWPSLAHAISDYRVRHDDRALVSNVSPKDSASENLNSVYNAVECADSAWPPSHAQWDGDAQRMRHQAPLAAWYNMWSVAPCATWRAPHGRPIRITGAGLPRILMFNSVDDMATPYVGALAMHRSLPSSVLVTETNAGEHGVYALSGNAVATRWGTDYLVHGTLPRGDIRIPGHPLPDPAKPGNG